MSNLVWNHAAESTTDVLDVDFQEVIMGAKNAISAQVETPEDVENIVYAFTETQRAVMLLTITPGSQVIAILVKSFTGNVFDSPSEVAEFLSTSDYLVDEDIFKLFVEAQMAKVDPSGMLDKIIRSACSE